jgi:hypothetical protein
LQDRRGGFNTLVFHDKTENRPVAQLAEHPLDARKAPGSNPGGTTQLNARRSQCAMVSLTLLGRSNAIQCPAFTEWVHHTLLGVLKQNAAS